MSFIWDSFTAWLKTFLISAINSNLSGLFDTVNAQVNSIAGEVGQTPQSWNGNVFTMVQNLSQNVIAPIAGIILTFVACYELISMVVDKNNLHNFDSFIFYKWIFKTFVAVYLVSHTFDITAAVFEMAQHVVQQSAGVINTTSNLSVSVNTFQASLQAMQPPELFGLLVETLFVGLTIHILGACIFLIVYGRLLEIYMYCSIGPIPMATLTNREWGDVGKNYIKSLLALGFQGFFIMVCIGIYAALVQSITLSSNIHLAIWTCLGYTVLLCFALFKTGSLSKSVFNAR
ncbi:MAG: CD0415/CD1112 family protein [Ethanoligenens sp.]